MCGISGLAGSTYSAGEMRAYLKHACKTLRHRGPDQDGIYLDSGIGLGISRLAIRDQEKGIQPMTRGELTLVFNGELYDAEQLKERLLRAGYVFETNSDTEIFLNALLEFGLSILPEITGMFAFALWNGKTRTLSLGRDRWGEKPLYYAQGKDFLAFASEIKALKVWPHLQWDISLEDIQIFLRNSYLPCPRTGWRNVFKLEQGTVLVWKENQISITRYFFPTIAMPTIPSKKNPEDLFQLLSSSVKNCSITDRPLGSFLSGGIDSTTITYLLTRQIPNAPIFSLFWDDKSYSEETYIKEVVQAFDLQHYFVKCDPTFFVDNFDQVARLYDEPFADESMIPTYCLARFAKQHVDVVLTGDGADEFFHGYERYFFQGDFENYLEVFAASSTQALKLICNNDFLYGSNPLLSFYYSQNHSDIDKKRLRSWVDIHTYLADDILMKVDRACMGVGLENRSPFLTPQVTDFALNCPIQELVRSGSRGKEILRSAMKGHIPDIILERKKMGFGVPLKHWFRTHLNSWMTQRILEGELLKTGWLSKQGLEQLISDPLNNSRTIFNLLVLDVWLQENRSAQNSSLDITYRIPSR
jgi:asparagine synthase (glutamine-hydrolysing)